MSSIIFLFLGFVLLSDGTPPKESLPQSYWGLYEEEVGSWIPPEDMKKGIPYYLSGYDKDGRPVWVLEFGKYDVRKFVTSGDESFKNLEKYADQIIWNGLTTVNEDPKDPDIPNDVIIILDIDGYDLHQLGSAKAVAFVLRFIQRLLGLFKYIDSIYAINTNFVAQNLVNLVKPILGEEFNRVQIFGTNKEKWLPVLLKKIPRSQLPPWYGGTEDFKPVRVYG